MAARPTTPVRTLVRFLTRLAAFVVVVAVGGLGVAWVLGADDRVPRTTACWATLDGTRWPLTPEQAETTALLAGTSLSRALPARALTIAVATGMQESRLANIDYGDRDSVGIFQQRPSQGWGTVEQIMDPVYSTNTFFDALEKVAGYTEMEITVAAQTVQRSAFPDAYAQHESLARAWANALYGYSPRAVTCTLPDAAGPGDPAAVVERAARDLPWVPAEVTAAGVVLRAEGLGASEDDAERLTWALAHWAVAVAHPLDLTEVRTTTSVWDRAGGTWEAVTEDGPDVAVGQVLLVPTP